MFTVRNLLAAAVFLFGASYLWLTPVWLGLGDPKLGVFDPKGLLAMITVLGFAAAASGIFRAASWWEPIAIGSALVGIISGIPYWIFAHGVATVDQVAVFQNIGLHLVGGAAVAAFLLYPTTERWLTGRL
jgi:hypothetical protein